MKSTKPKAIPAGSANCFIPIQTLVYGLALAGVLLTGCSTHLHSESDFVSRKVPVRILPVGDSITAGYTDNPAWRVPFEFGYRGVLFQMLRSNGIPIQFVGTSPEPWNGLWQVPTNRPVPDLRLLDQDYHEGHGAKATAFVVQHIASWVRDAKPDIVLLMIGINDIAAGSTNVPDAARTNLYTILQSVIDVCPETHVIVAQTIPYTRPTPAIVDLNRFIRETLVPDLAARGAKVSTVDQFANFVIRPESSSGDPALYSNGYNHPNAEGYRRMARTWLEEIQRVIAARTNCIGEKTLKAALTIPARKE